MKKLTRFLILATLSVVLYSISSYPNTVKASSDLLVFCGVVCTNETRACNAYRNIEGGTCTILAECKRVPQGYCPAVGEIIVE